RRSDAGSVDGVCSHGHQCLALEQHRTRNHAHAVCHGRRWLFAERTRSIAPALRYSRTINRSFWTNLLGPGLLQLDAINRGLRVASCSDVGDDGALGTKTAPHKA